MPIEVQIDHQRRCVMAAITGDIRDVELLDYQKSVWSDPALAGYDELIDATGAGCAPEVSSSGLSQISQCAASMDTACERSRLAVVAPQDVYFGLARMYEVLRSETPGSRKAVSVFRSRADAEAWLGIRTA